MTPEQAAAKAAETLARAADNAITPDVAGAYVGIADGWTRLYAALTGVPTSLPLMTYTPEVRIGEGGEETVAQALDRALRQVNDEGQPGADEPSPGKPAEAAALTYEERALIHAALRTLPTKCLYHGENTEPRDRLLMREACCDTGIAAQRRKLAEQALLTHIARSSS